MSSPPDFFESPDSPDLQTLLENITPEIYEALKRAVELGKWPGGNRLTPAQRETCMQAVIYYDGRHKSERDRVGYIQRDDHEHCGSEGDPQHDTRDNRWSEEQLLVLRDMQQNNPVKH